MGLGGQHFTTAASLLRETQYPLYRRLVGTQGQYGQVQKISPPPGFNPGTTQPVVNHYTDWAIPVYACA